MLFHEAFLISSAFVITVACAPNFNVTPPMKVSVYYDTLCYDCAHFILEQLYPNYGRFKDRILIDFVPYGNANHTKSTSGVWQFTCEHGSDECRANKYQACALDQKKGQNSDVEFVNCIMGLDDDSYSDVDNFKHCAVNNGYNWSTITKCYEDGKGDELLAAYGDRTHSLIRKTLGAPVVVLNDRMKIDGGCVTDFAKMVCDEISSPKPKVCSFKWTSYL